MPTLDGGLCILPESEIDWQELELICSDEDRPTHLAASLADLMDEDSEWNEYVVPDLEENFRAQAQVVAGTIEKARASDDSAIFITPAEAERWYGAINQVRLSLHARFDIEELGDSSDINDASPELKSAYYRNRFYLLLQSMLLEYILDDDKS
ncbi:MAG: DUF2017 family protein [Akkermansiaceae bacterium]|nr:DUF2017 family protein [Akkermansiaceae bacterium]